HPGPRLYHEMMPSRNGIRHCLCHLKLLRPDFVIAKPPGDGAVRSQNRRVGHAFIIRIMGWGFRTEQGALFPTIFVWFPSGQEGFGPGVRIPERQNPLLPSLGLQSTIWDLFAPEL